MMNETPRRPSPESLLAMIKEGEQAKLRVYIGAAAGGWRSEMGLAVIATIVVLALNAFGGFETLSDFRGDNDSLMRLVQVRDLIGGQDWYDLSQYRMGPEGGFTMHWSRVVDAPIAVIVVAGTVLTGSVALAETVAQVLLQLAELGVGERVHRVDDDGPHPAARLRPRRLALLQYVVDDRDDVRQGLAGAGTGGEHIGVTGLRGLDGLPLVQMEGERTSVGTR